MSANDPARRGFLRHLASLPLIGGGVTLLGNPTAAAEPVTRELLDSYDAWLDLERSWLKFERFGPGGMHMADKVGMEVVFRSRLTGECWDGVPYNNGGARYRHNKPSPSTRAAVVLSAVGCDWREEGR